MDAIFIQTTTTTTIVWWVLGHRRTEWETSLRVVLGGCQEELAARWGFIKPWHHSWRTMAGGRGGACALGEEGLCWVLKMRVSGGSCVWFYRA